jgi:RNA polymerase sigma factor (sigma-70 family)
MLDPEVVAFLQSFLNRQDRGGSAEEERACEEFTRICIPIIRCKMRRVHDPLDEIEDLVQDVCVVLLRKLPTLEYDPLRAPLESWVSVIAERQARKRLRRRWKLRAHPLVDAHAEMLIDPQPNPDVELECLLEHERFATLVSEFAATVCERDSHIILMHWLEGCSLSRIASELDRSEDAVWWVIRRVRPKLLDYLRSRGLRHAFETFG